jgi:hypothetical protein
MSERSSLDLHTPCPGSAGTPILHERFGEARPLPPGRATVTCSRRSLSAAHWPTLR